MTAVGEVDGVRVVVKDVIGHPDLVARLLEIDGCYVEITHDRRRARVLGTEADVAAGRELRRSDGWWVLTVGAFEEDALGRLRAGEGTVEVRARELRAMLALEAAA